MNFKQVILASGSPRRLEILREHNINPVIMPASVDESLPEGISMEDAVMFLSFKKARAVEDELMLTIPSSDREEKDSNDLILEEEAEDADSDPLDEEHNPESLAQQLAEQDGPMLILAADTVVYDPDLGILGKPRDHDDAFRMLSSLRGKKHQVATGCSLILSGMPARRIFCEVTDVYCKNYSDDDIESYIASGEPFDKAGAYGIQGAFGQYIDHIEGSYDNVVGLPYERLAGETAVLDEYYRRDSGLK
ncbi:MAG: Maf family protein [Eubacterium sp.]